MSPLSSFQMDRKSVEMCSVVGWVAVLASLQEKMDIRLYMPNTK